MKVWGRMGLLLCKYSAYSTLHYSSQMFFKIGVLKKLAIITAWPTLSQENTCVVTLLKRDSNTGGFSDYYETFKNSYFYRTPPVAASVCRRNLLKKFGVISGSNQANHHFSLALSFNLALATVEWE